MSGGSYDYIYSTIEDLKIERSHLDPRRMAFQKLLKLVAKALHDIEWVDSCDYSPGDENQAIDAVFSFLGSDPSIVTKAAAFDGLKAQLELFLDLKKD